MAAGSRHRPTTEVASTSRSRSGPLWVAFSVAALAALLFTLAYHLLQFLCVLAGFTVGGDGSAPTISRLLFILADRLVQMVGLRPEHGVSAGIVWAAIVFLIVFVSTFLVTKGRR